MTGLPRRCGWCACSTEAKKASMSTSRITAFASARREPERAHGPSRRTRPRATESPGRPSRIEDQFVAVVFAALDREVTQHRLTFAAIPLSRHGAHADDPPLPAKTDRPERAV